MRHTRTTMLLVACLLAVGAVGCSSGDETAKDCAAALAERTGGDPADTPTVGEAEARVDALDKTLADMVNSGYEDVAEDAFDMLEEKTSGGGKDRPGACEPLSDDDYTTLLTASAIEGLGWTGEGGEFDKVKMAEGLGD